MKFDQKLFSAIESLYSAFARYSQPQQIEYCLCGCTKPDAVVPLLAAPLRELRFADLEDYSFSAMTTQGSLRDYKYFLPRLLEGIASEPYGLNPEILFGKLRYARWLTWDTDEVLAVRTYLNAIWNTGISNFPFNDRLPAFCEIETLIAAIANTGEALHPYLDIWNATRGEAADRHLIQFVTQYGVDFDSGRVISFGFWGDLAEQAEELRRWLLARSTITRIETSAHLLPKDGWEHLFGPAVEILRAQSAVS